MVCTAGAWSTSTVQCVLDTAPPAPPACSVAAPTIANGVWVLEPHGEAAQLQCNPGFEISGDASPIACHRGVFGPDTWDPSVATCVASSFGPPPPPPVTGQTCVGTPPTVANGAWNVNGATATLQCNPSYTGTASVPCTNGAWAVSPFNPPRCTVSQQLPPPPPPPAATCTTIQPSAVTSSGAPVHGQWTIQAGGATATLHCDQGYTIPNVFVSPSVSCDAGAWSLPQTGCQAPPPPTGCTAALPRVTGGTYTHIDPNTARLECAAGYTLSTTCHDSQGQQIACDGTASTIVCINSNAWSPARQVCTSTAPPPPPTTQACSTTTPGWPATAQGGNWMQTTATGATLNCNYPLVPSTSPATLVCTNGAWVPGAGQYVPSCISAGGVGRRLLDADVEPDGGR